MRAGAALLWAALALPAPALAAGAAAGFRSAQADAQGLVVDLVTTGEAAALPAHLPATLSVAGADRAVVLERLPGDDAAGHARYRLRSSGDANERMALLAIPTLGISGVAVTLPATAQAAADPVGRPAATPATRMAGAERNRFLDNLAPYRATYAVYGPGTNSSTRIQLSFQYQLFGRRRAEGELGSWADGITFAFTQRMFWDVEARSAPIRNVDYMPELFYRVRPRAIGGGATLGGRAGVAHESNGRDGAASRSLNIVYLAPEATLPLGGDWQLTVTPRVWAYVGGRDGNEDIARYRGHTGLDLALGRADGLRLAAETRLNPSSGKGAAEAEVSYPLSSPGRGLALYMFGQGFAGYGENLLDYNRRQTRVRLGVGITR